MEADLQHRQVDTSQGTREIKLRYRRKFEIKLRQRRKFEIKKHFRRVFKIKVLRPRKFKIKLGCRRKFEKIYVIRGNFISKDILGGVLKSK
jgi:hypothetical protein